MMVTGSNFRICMMYPFTTRMPADDSILTEDVTIFPREQITQSRKVDAVADESHAAIAQTDHRPAGVQAPWSGNHFSVMDDVGFVRIRGQVAVNQGVIPGGRDPRPGSATFVS